MSKNKNNHRGVRKRVFLAPMTGDPGPAWPEHVSSPLPDGVDLDSMDTRALLQLALKVGVDAAKLTELERCSEHKSMRQVKENFHDSKNYPKYVIGLDLLRCSGCYLWFRTKKPLELEA